MPGRLSLVLLLPLFAAQAATAAVTSSPVPRVADFYGRNGSLFVNGQELRLKACHTHSPGSVCCSAPLLRQTALLGRA